MEFGQQVIELVDPNGYWKPKVRSRIIEAFADQEFADAELILAEYASVVDSIFVVSSIGVSKTYTSGAFNKVVDVTTKPWTAQSHVDLEIGPSPTGRTRAQVSVYAHSDCNQDRECGCRSWINMGNDIDEIGWPRVQREAARLAEKINEAIPNKRLSSPPAGANIADELMKLAALRDQGVLTEAEFSMQKAKLLG